MSAPSGDLLLAEEYVLGLLADDEVRAFEARLAGDDALKAAVAEARERYLALDLTAEQEPAGPELWRRIEDGIRQPQSTVVPFARPSIRHAGRPAGWSRGFLQGAVAAAVVAAAALAGLFGTGIVGTTPEPVFIAVLLDDAAQPGAIVEAFGDDVRIVPLVDVAVPEGQTMQVWTLPSPETGPVSLGLLPAAQETALAGPPLPSPLLGQLYEITLEPDGGSPTGRPTGPVLFKGYAAMPL
jgi:anti-sigma-K factor RskA